MTDPIAVTEAGSAAALNDSVWFALIPVWEPENRMPPVMLSDVNCGVSGLRTPEPKLAE